MNSFTTNAFKLDKSVFFAAFAEVSSPRLLCWLQIPKLFSDYQYFTLSQTASYTFW